MATQNTDEFYPVPYVVLDMGRGLRLHLDQGDNSYESKRSFKFDRSSVVHRGLIQLPTEYTLIKDVIDHSNQVIGSNPNTLMEALAEISAIQSSIR